MSFANNSNRDKNSKILEKFVIALNNAAKDCLESKSNDMKARNYLKYKENKNKQLKNDQLLLFPKLQVFFKFLFNFSIYCHCYPRDNHKNAQAYYVTQYFSFKNVIFKNLFDKQYCQYEASLDRFNYFSSNGTIVHNAVECNMRYYCKILIVNDGREIWVLNY